MYQLFKISHCKVMCTETLPEHLKKFRIGTHKLPVNNQKNTICLGMRLCTICDEGVLDEEINFIYVFVKL